MKPGRLKFEACRRGTSTYCHELPSHISMLQYHPLKSSERDVRIIDHKCMMRKENQVGGR